ncbi:MAG: TyeA family type III secretion system gatekeeper subunit [Candidatus Competibacteraceae bacterium]|jgi:type III secretion system TyeA family effector delivery regulator|nr:TyeA family type III secretion system gatekeeper subunit [Candidatus Competibacteraceae bacterium]
MRTQKNADAYRGSDLLKEVLELQQNKWIRPEQIAALPSKLGIRELTHEINFLREFKALIHAIPLKAYAEPEQRPRFLDAIQQALDEAIEREEAEEE